MQHAKLPQQSAPKVQNVRIHRRSTWTDTPAMLPKSVRSCFRRLLLHLHSASRWQIVGYTAPGKMQVWLCTSDRPLQGIETITGVVVYFRQAPAGQGRETIIAGVAVHFPSEKRETVVAAKE